MFRNATTFEEFVVKVVEKPLQEKRTKNREFRNNRQTLKV